MSQSRSSERDERQNKYSSARQIAEKAEAGYQGSYLKIPSGVKLYKPKAGKALLDIIPFVAGVGNPRADEGCLHYDRLYWAHRAIGPSQEMVICPAQSMGKPCPICEERARLANEGDEGDDEARKALMPKKRQLLLVIDRKDGDDAPIELFDTSTFGFDDALNEAINSADTEEEKNEFALFHSLEDGFTLRVLFEEEQIGRGQKFVKATRIDFKDRAPYKDDILEETFCLDDILIVLDYDDLKKKFMGGAAGSKKNGKAEEDAPRGRGRRTAEGDDEHPVRGRRGADDDKGGETDAPRSRRSREDAPVEDAGEAAEEPPRSRRGRTEEAEEAPPTRRGRSEPEAGEEEPSTRGKSGKGGNEADWDRFSDKGGKGGKGEAEEAPRSRRGRAEPEAEEEAAPPARRGRPPGRPPAEEAPTSRRGRR